MSCVGQTHVKKAFCPGSLLLALCNVQDATFGMKSAGPGQTRNVWDEATAKPYC
jgi:hypothetical protein